MFGKVSARDVTPAGLQRSAKAPQAKTATPQQEDDLLVQQTLRNNAPLDARQVQGLQRAAGNRAVLQALGRHSTSPRAIQPKLNVGAADDPYEREADRVAAQVTSLTTSAPPPMGVSSDAADPPARRSVTPPAITPLVQRRAASPARIQRELTDQDLLTGPDALKSLGGGSVNPVYRAKYQKALGSSGSDTGYFKPEPEKGSKHEFATAGNMWANLTGVNLTDGLHMGARAVASSRLNKKLGLDIISDEFFARHADALGKVMHGTVSSEVAGKPMYEHVYEDEITAAEAASMDPDTVKQVNGKWMKHSGTEYYGHDLSNPVTQKGMSDLQLFDAITGQADRHGGNIYVDPATGKVKGIDNDQSFGPGGQRMTAHKAAMKKWQAQPENKRGPKPAAKNFAPPKAYQAARDAFKAGNAEVQPTGMESVFYSTLRGDAPSVADVGSVGMKYHGLPSLVDQGTADKILKFKAKNLGKVLNQKGSPQKLSKDEIKNAQRRYREVKAHLKNLKKEGKLVQNWDQSTYQQSLGEADAKFATQQFETSYTKRSAVLMQGSDRPLRPVTPPQAVAQQMAAPQGANAPLRIPTVMPPLPSLPPQALGKANKQPKWTPSTLNAQLEYMGLT